MKKLLLLTLILLSVSVLRAQDESGKDAYGLPPGFGREDDADEALPYAPLSAYDGPFDALSRYNFSFVRYRRRGYDAGCGSATLDGIDLSDAIAGGMYWNVLSALRAAPAEELRSAGLKPGPGAMGDLGGATAFRTDPGLQPGTVRIGWIFTDRRFRQGFRFRVASGTLPGGWALTLAGTRRWGHDAHVRGVFTDDGSFFASVGREWGKHSLGVTVLGAPSQQGLRSPSTAEAFALSGNRLYNPAWGWQQGRIRSSRVRSDFLPLAVLTWRFTPGDRLTLSASASGLWGQSAYSSLDWYDAANPQPDYYRYMPGFYDNPAVGETVAEAWRAGDARYTQVDWDGLYRAHDRDRSLPASYVLGSAVRQYKHYQLAASFDYRPSRRFGLEGGVRGRIERTAFWNRLDDLLGAPFLTDIDPYLIDDEYFGDKLQNDMRHPGRQVRAGDRYGYFYDIDYARYELWALGSVRSRNLRWEGYLGLQAGQMAFSRDGHYEKEQFPGPASFGRSERPGFTGYAVKTGVAYRFNPAHGLTLDAVFGTREPSPGDAFVSPAYRNALTGTTQPESRIGGELGYRMSIRGVSLTLCGYVSSLSGASEVRRYYDDLAAVFADMVVSGIGRLYAGVELGAEFSLASRLSLRMAAAWSRNSYRTNPTVEIVSDKDGSPIDGPVRAGMQGFRLGGNPEQIASAELRYEGVKMWMASVSASYAGGHFVLPSPLRRTRRIYDHAVSPEALGEMIAQERLPDAVTLNLFLSKTFRLGRHYLSLSGSVNNLANRGDIVYSGYEPMRLRKSGTGDERRVGAFPSRYLYAYPRTYYLTVNFRY